MAILFLFMESLQENFTNALMEAIWKSYKRKHFHLDDTPAPQARRLLTQPSSLASTGTIWYYMAHANSASAKS